MAAVIRRGEQYLVCRRPAHKRHGGMWEFPGGKLEAGETHLAAARRELAEELGLVVTGVGPAIFSAGDPGSPFVIDFLEVAIEGEPRPIEHSEIAWLSLEQLLPLALAPSDRRFAEHLQQIGT